MISTKWLDASKITWLRFIPALGLIACTHSGVSVHDEKTLPVSPTSVVVDSTLAPCTPKSNSGDFCLALLSELRPTQFAVGYRDVKRKRDAIEAAQKSGEFSSSHFFKNPGLVVKGPEDIFYLVDGHHRARASVDADVREFRVRVIEDFSHLPMADFWMRMKENQMVWLYDANGLGPQNPIHIPAKVQELADDPYRTLAEDAQDRGANIKTDKLFQEFYWANFYRQGIDKALLTTNYESAILEALKLAKTTEAKNLPGYNGP